MMMAFGITRSTSAFRYTAPLAVTSSLVGLTGAGELGGKLAAWRTTVVLDAAVTAADGVWAGAATTGRAEVTGAAGATTTLGAGATGAETAGTGATLTAATTGAVATGSALAGAL